MGRNLLFPGTLLWFRNDHDSLRRLIFAVGITVFSCECFQLFQIRIGNGMRILPSLSGLLGLDEKSSHFFGSNLFQSFWPDEVNFGLCRHGNGFLFFIDY